MKKIIIRVDATSYTVLSTDAMVIGILEEELQQLGIRNISCHYGAVNWVEAPSNQGEDAKALDLENWLRTAIDERRPAGYSNWETWAVVEYLNKEEGPHAFRSQDPQEFKRYVHTKKAPPEFYEIFEARPVGDPKIINWAEVVEALQD